MGICGSGESGGGSRRKPCVPKRMSGAVIGEKCMYVVVSITTHNNATTEMMINTLSASRAHHSSRCSCCARKARTKRASSQLLHTIYVASHVIASGERKTVKFSAKGNDQLGGMCVCVHICNIPACQYFTFLSSL